MILAAGLSPAWQQIVSLDALELGEVNRAASVHWCGSGKVLNVAVAAAHLGASTTAITTAGGETGGAMMADLAAINVDLAVNWIPTSQPTRVCTTLLETNGRTTELVENTGPLEETALDQFLQVWSFKVQSANVAALTGSFPPNVPTDLFARLVQSTSIRCIVDVQREPLNKCLEVSPFLIKPNREELQATVGRSLNSLPDLVSAMREFNAAGAEWVVVSDGPDSLVVTSAETAVQFTPPHVSVVNPIGCGDCLAAGIAVGLDRGDDVLEAVRFGIGAAAQNAELLLPSRLDPDRACALARLVSMKELN